MLDWTAVYDCDCGHPECRGSKSYTTDPYQEELYSDHSLYLMCAGDIYESKQDI